MYSFCSSASVGRGSSCLPPSAPFIVVICIKKHLLPGSLGRRVKRTFSSIFFVKITDITICTEQKSLCPGGNPCHLLTDGTKAHARVSFDDQFVMHMGYDTAAPKCPHGIHQNVTACCLDDVLHELGTIAFKPLPFLCTTDTLVGHRLTAELILSHAWFYIGKNSAGRKLYEQHAAPAAEADAVGGLGSLFLDGLFDRTVHIPPEADDIRIGLSPGRYQVRKLLFGQPHLKGTHGFQRTYGTSVAECQFCNLALLSEVTVDAVLFYRHTKHLRSRCTVDVTAVFEHLGTPRFSCKPGNDPRLNGRKVRYDEVLIRRRDKGGTDQLRQSIRDIIVKHIQSIIIAAPYKTSRFSQIGHMVLRKVLQLHQSSGKAACSVGSVELEHPSDTVVGTHRVLHCLKDTDTIHLQFRAVHLLRIDGIHLAGDRLYFCGLPKEVIFQSRQVLILNLSKGRL